MCNHLERGWPPETPAEGSWSPWGVDTRSPSGPSQAVEETWDLGPGAFRTVAGRPSLARPGGPSAPRGHSGPQEHLCLQQPPEKALLASSEPEVHPPQESLLGFLVQDCFPRVFSKLDVSKCSSFFPGDPARGLMTSSPSEHLEDLPSRRLCSASVFGTQGSMAGPTAWPRGRRLIRVAGHGAAASHSRHRLTSVCFSLGPSQHLSLPSLRLLLPTCPQTPFPAGAWCGRLLMGSVALRKQRLPSTLPPSPRTVRRAQTCGGQREDSVRPAPRAPYLTTHGSPGLDTGVSGIPGRLYPA